MKSICIDRLPAGTTSLVSAVSRNPARTRRRRTFNRRVVANLHLNLRGLEEVYICTFSHFKAAELTAGVMFYELRY